LTVGSSAQIFHFDGSAFTLTPSGEPDGNPNGTVWHDVNGSGESDVWAVGNKGRVTHFDGTSWTSSQSAAVSDLDDVWVAPDGNAWAGGQSGVALRYTPGGSWQKIAALAFSTLQWVSVTGTSSSDVWIGAQQGQLYHFDGSTWKSVTVAGFGTAIEKLWALAPNQVWGAADAGQIVHYDGASWTRADLKVSANLLGLWVGANGEGWAVGEQGTVQHRRL
jgi:hypothetical protein